MASETQIDNKIKFLDCTINISNKKFNFNIYRKPTQTNIIIPNYSNHLFSLKVFISILYDIDSNVCVPQNKFNYENKFNINCDVGIKKQFLCKKYKTKWKKNYLILW